jgi:hypothetical protein
MKKILIKTYVCNEIEISELDLQIYDTLKFQQHKDKLEYIKINPNGKNSYEGESTPIEFSLLEKELDKLKRLGATHVEIVYHEDHFGYILNGVKFEIVDENNKRFKTILAYRNKLSRSDLIEERQILKNKLKAINDELRQSKQKTK